MTAACYVGTDGVKDCDRRKETDYERRKKEERERRNNNTWVSGVDNIVNSEDINSILRR